MRLAKCAALFLLCIWFSGCAASLQPENHSYALSMSIDRTDEGLIQMGVLLSSNNSSGTDMGGGSGGGSKGNDYPRYYTVGSTFFEALDLMESSSPRSLNMSQLQSIIVSQRLASEPTFKELIEELTLTNHLYGTPNMIICLGSARDFMDADKPQVGTRLASELSTTLDYYASIGYVPSSRLAGVYYAMNSIYGDPVIMTATTKKADGVNIVAAPGILGDGMPGTLAREGFTQNEFRGCALFKDDAMVGVLDGAQTRWLQVIRNQISQFTYMCQGEPLQVYVKTHPKISIDLGHEPIVVNVHLVLTPGPRRQMPDKTVLEQQIRAELTALFAHCQSLGTDPFAFAEIAAIQFPTVEGFLKYRWPDHWQAATINLSIDIEGQYR